MKPKASDSIPTPTDEDLKRVQAVLREVGGQHVHWGASSVLEVLLVEQRLRAERESSDRLTRATWTLVLATVVLAVATVALVFVTLQS